MTETTAATKAAPNRLLALWSSVIGKKVVMAVTGAVLILFVIAHMVGNLKIFSGPEEINAYSRFLREVGWPELGYGQLLWIVRSVLFLCVILHITAAVQLTRLNWQARPVGYESRKNVETTWGAVTMRWGGVLLAVFIVFHLFHFTGGMVGFQPGQFEHLMVYQNVVAGFSVRSDCVVLHHRHGRLVSPSRSRDLEHAADAGLGHPGQHKKCESRFQDCGSDYFRWFYLGADFGACGLGALRVGARYVVPIQLRHRRMERNARIQHSVRSNRREVGKIPL